MPRGPSIPPGRRGRRPWPNLVSRCAPESWKPWRAGWPCRWRGVMWHWPPPSRACPMRATAGPPHCRSGGVRRWRRSWRSRAGGTPSSGEPAGTSAACRHLSGSLSAWDCGGPVPGSRHRRQQPVTAVDLDRSDRRAVAARLLGGARHLGGLPGRRRARDPGRSRSQSGPGGPERQAGRCPLSSRSRVSLMAATPAASRDVLKVGEVSRTTPVGRGGGTAHLGRRRRGPAEAAADDDDRFADPLMRLRPGVPGPHHPPDGVRQFGGGA